MCRTVTAVIVGSIVAFMVGWANWTVLHLWEDAFKPIPPAVESSIVPTIAEKLGPGSWFFPGMDMEAMCTMFEEENQKMWDAYVPIHEKGPVGMILVSPGSTPMSGKTFVRGFVIDVLGAIGVALVLCMGRGGVLCRWLHASIVITLITTLFYGALVNWMELPSVFVGRIAADIILTWTVAALAMALIMRRGGGSCCGASAKGDSCSTGDCGCAPKKCC